MILWRVCMLLGRHFGFVLLGCVGGFRYYLMGGWWLP